LPFASALPSFGCPPSRRSCCHHHQPRDQRRRLLHLGVWMPHVRRERFTGQAGTWLRTAVCCCARRRYS